MAGVSRWAGRGGARAQLISWDAVSSEALGSFLYKDTPLLVLWKNLWQVHITLNITSTLRPRISYLGTCSKEIKT
jgi:hypothetical protein